jgi:magnesium chelatase family protein
MDKMKLTARAIDRVLKVALTIADLEESKVEARHIAEALQYRRKT